MHQVYISPPKKSILEKFAGLKSQTMDMADHAEDYLQSVPELYVSKHGTTKRDLYLKLDRLSHCAERLEFANYDDGTERLHSGTFCQIPAICRTCASRISTRRRTKIMPEIQSLVDSGLTPYMVTFTIDHDRERPLVETLDKLRASIRSWRLLGQKRKTKKGFSLGESHKVKAGFFGYEIKRGLDRAWHVHAHSFLFTDQPIDYSVYDKNEKERLSKEYRGKIPKTELDKIAKHTLTDKNGKIFAVSKFSLEYYKVSGSKGIDIRPVRPRYSKKKHAMLSVAEQASEILKYATKIDKDNPQDVIDLLLSTENRRLFELWGDLRKAKISYSGDENSDRGMVPDTIYGVLFNGQTRKYYDEKVQAEFGSREIAALKNDYLRQQAYILAERKRTVKTYLDARNDIDYCNLSGIIDNEKKRFSSVIARLWDSFKSEKSRLLRAA